MIKIASNNIWIFSIIYFCILSANKSTMALNPAHPGDSSSVERSDIQGIEQALPENVNELNSTVYNQIRNAVYESNENIKFKHLLGASSNEERTQNALGDLCVNFKNLSKESKLNIWIKLLIAMGLSESTFVRKVTDSKDPYPPHGFWQISNNAKKHPPQIDECDFQNKVENIRNDVKKNVECIFSFFELRNKNSLPIYGDATDAKYKFEEYWDTQKPQKGKGTVTALHWSVLRTGNRFESKLVPVFKHLTPECQLSEELANKVKSTSFACGQISTYLKLKTLPGTTQSLGYPDDYPGSFQDKCP